MVARIPPSCPSRPAPGGGTQPVRCEDCGLYGICLVAGLGDEASTLLDRLVGRRQPVPRGAVLFAHGQTFDGVYAVKHGSFKTTVPMAEGGEQVVGFHFPGELLGLEAIKAGRHHFTAQALESASVCKLRFDDLQALGKRLPDFQYQLIQAMSEQVLAAQSLSELTGKQGSEERLAAFLVNLSNRLRMRGLHSTDLRLSMSRQDIGSFLGLAMETVSRLFTRFQEEGLLDVQRKRIRILDLPRLTMVANSWPKSR